MDFPKEQLWELYKNIPEDLQKAVFSEEVAKKIYDACSKNNIKGEKIKEVSKHTGFVLLGIIPPNEFDEALENEVKLDKETAQRIFQEINSSVFLSFRKSLEALYGAENLASPPSLIKKNENRIPQKGTASLSDTYREPIE